MYVFEICAEGIFETLPWWLENVKSRLKVAPFSNERHFEIWFPKREQLRFSEVNYLNFTKKTQFFMWQLHFPPKQGETRTSHGPIPHQLNTWEELNTTSYQLLCSSIWLPKHIKLDRKRTGDSMGHLEFLNSIPPTLQLSVFRIQNIVQYSLYKVMNVELQLESPHLKIPIASIACLNFSC